MKKKILKKVLCEVLDVKKVKSIKKDFTGEFDPVYQINYKNYKSHEFTGGNLLLNKYELGYLCKQYILNLGYDLYINFIKDEVEAAVYKNNEIVYYDSQSSDEEDSLLEAVNHIRKLK